MTVDAQCLGRDWIPPPMKECVVCGRLFMSTRDNLCNKCWKEAHDDGKEEDHDDHPSS